MKKQRFLVIFLVVAVIVLLILLSAEQAYVLGGYGYGY